MLVVKNPPASVRDVRDVGSIPGLGGSPGGGNGNPFSILAWRIPMDRGAWQATVYRVTKSQTPLKWLSSSSRGSHSIYTSMLLSAFISPSLSSSQPLSISVLYVCVCIAALQIGSSVPYFWIAYIHINIRCFFFLPDLLPFVHINNAILLSYEKEWIWVSSNELGWT